MKKEKLGEKGEQGREIEEGGQGVFRLSQTEHKRSTDLVNNHRQKKTGSNSFRGEFWLQKQVSGGKFLIWLFYHVEAKLMQKSNCVLIVRMMDAWCDIRTPQ